MEYIRTVDDKGRIYLKELVEKNSKLLGINETGDKISLYSEEEAEKKVHECKEDYKNARGEELIELLKRRYSQYCARLIDLHTDENGRITIPKKLLESIGVNSNDLVIITTDENETYIKKGNR